MISKGAVTDIQTPPEGGFFYTLFLVPKKDGGQIPVINLKFLNFFIDAPDFKIEGIHTLKSPLKGGDKLVKIDLKNAYFSVPISQKHRKFLCFQFKNNLYQFNCLPFSLASAPWVFTKTLKPIAALGRELGIRLVVYIDDILLMAETREKARDHASGLIYLFQCLGFTINSEKTILEPSLRLKFLGFMVDTINMELSLPTQKIEKIRVESRQQLEAEHVTCRALSRLIGKMNATNQVIPPAPLFLPEPTNRPAISPQEREPGIRKNPSNLSRQQGGTNLVGHSDDKMEWQDGANNRTRPDHRIRCLNPRLGSLSPEHQHRGTLVSTGEGMAYKLPGTASGNSSIENIRQTQNRDISVNEDRQHNSCAYINNQGGTVSKELISLTWDLRMWCLERNIHIQAQYLPGVMNQTTKDFFR